MNILFWVVQALLALMCGAGGAYKVFNYSELVTVPPNGALSRGVWTGLGTFEMLCAVLLILPMLLKRMPALTPVAAAGLVVENLALAVLLFAPYSMAFTAKNPLVWVILAAIMAAIVAFGRFTGSAASAGA